MNYAKWAIMMDAWLVKKGVWDIVEGSKTRPTATVNTKPVKSFTQRQAEARSEIILHVEESQLAYVRDRDPKAIWDGLATIYRARGFATRRALRHRFFGLSKRTEQLIPAWIAEVRSAAFRLEEIEAEVSDEDMIMVLTRGLPDEYETFVVTLDSTPPSDFTLEYVIARLLNEESRHVTSRDDEPKALAAKGQGKTPLAQITCFNCGKKGHYQFECPEPKKEATAGLAQSEPQYEF
jgi:hypothetical protein